MNTKIAIALSAKAISSSHCANRYNSRNTHRGAYLDHLDAASACRKMSRITGTVKAGEWIKGSYSHEKMVLHHLAQLRKLGRKNDKKKTPR